MPAAIDIQSLTTAAEQAAGAGDFAAAEQNLRLVVELQESAAGPPGPELANTLNNLGVVYERLDRPADAEQCYRRAHAIASAVFEADHPFVALSAKNLQDFCEARGIPIEEAAVEPAASSEPVAAEPAAGPVAAGPDFPPSPRLRRDLDEAQRAETGSRANHEASDAADSLSAAPPSQAERRVTSTLVLIAAGVIGAIIAIAFATSRSQPTSGPPARPPSVTPAAPAAAAAPAPVAPDSAPVASNRPPPSAAGAVTAAKPAAPDAPVEPVVRPKRATPTLSEAALCRSVEIRAGEWLCDPAGGAPEPGTFFFYTRVASAGDATIEHRWYRNNRLYQRVPLRVRANQHGFRTYSRMTISAERAGDWRVEIRTADGDLLREERFKVGP